MPLVPPCPLCEFSSPQPIEAEEFYFHCPQCDLRFLHPGKRLQPDEEHQRYLQHENNATPGYRKFLEPLFHAIRPQLQTGASGLDFGCGPGSMLAEIFAADGFALATYDPFFAPDPSALSRHYDFVVTSEAAEHFHRPAVEFARLFSLLNPGGSLGVMTLLFGEQIDFATWYYRRDPTHVVFYSRSTFAWIARRFGFEDLAFHGERTVTLRRPFGK